jgi:hypothetical protein
MRDIIIVIVGIILIGIVWIGWTQYEATQGMPPGGVVPTGPTACTMEAMLCPDGSAVGRIGPKCEFAPCPQPAERHGGITGTVMLGPTCPVMRNPPDPQCADKPYAAKLVVTSVDGAKIVSTFESGSDGTFKLDLAPGEYVIGSAPSSSPFPRCGSNGTFMVKHGSYSEVIVSCDTGIR